MDDFTFLKIFHCPKLYAQRAFIVTFADMHIMCFEQFTSSSYYSLLSLSIFLYKSHIDNSGSDGGVRVP
jgi:hypothetical protein